MAILQHDLRTAARRPTRGFATFQEAKRRAGTTAFLCHSHQDAQLAKGLVTLLTEAGWKVYIDWEDTEMPSVPNRETAERIQGRIRQLDYFLFLATGRSMRSRWCPWEIGYADGVKATGRIFVIPTRDSTTTHGSEYLELYPRIDVDNAGRPGAWQLGSLRKEAVSAL